MSDWISVDDKLPFNGRMVLVFLNNDYEFGMIIDDKFHIFEHDNWVIPLTGNINYWAFLPERLKE